MKTYDASGNLKAEGTFSFTHEKPEDGVPGELITSIPTIGGNYDDNGQSVGSNKFWLLTLWMRTISQSIIPASIAVVWIGTTAAGMLISRLKQKPILNNMHSL
ncbi:hypothetical protein NXX09_06905 [Bacteroides uniformis]|nr:hypothetical protein [Bacteroides uniformis]